MKRKYALIIIILVFVFLLSSCELMVEQEPKGVIRVVSVGIDYNDIAAISKNLYGTCNDAYQVGQVLKALGEKEGTEVELYYLLSENNDVRATSDFIDDSYIEQQSDTAFYYPSQNSLIQVVDEINSKQNSQDMLFIFLAGHGAPNVEVISEYEITYSEDLSDDYNFVIPKNINQDDDEISKYFYKLSEYLSLVETIAGKKILINDFCFSGAMISDDYISLDLTTYYYANHPSTADLLFSSTSEKVLDDIYILSAAQSYQEAMDGSLHGSFTQALLDGLGWDEDNQVLKIIPVLSESINSSKIYLSTVANYTKRNDNYNYQTPKMTTSSNDIILFEF